MRPARPRVALAAGLLGLLGPACAVDSGPAPSYDAAPPADAAPIPDGAPAAVDATPACDDAQLEVTQTGHHAERYDYKSGGGAGCLGQCHNGNGLGPTYTAAGALYNRRTTGGDPIAGAYIYIIDGNGKVVQMMSAQNGFFWTDEDLAPPLRTYASGCPSALGMEADTSGNCNSSACHHEDNKIYLPLVSPGI